MTPVQLRATLSLRAEELAEFHDRAGTRELGSDVVRELLRQRNALREMVMRLLPDVGNGNAGPEAQESIEAAADLLDEVRG